VRIEASSRCSRLLARCRAAGFRASVCAFCQPPAHDLPGVTGRAVRCGALADDDPGVVHDLAHRHDLFDTLLEATRQHGRGHVIADDITQAPISYGRPWPVPALGRVSRAHPPAERVGALLPTSKAAVVTFALHAEGRVPAMLNFRAARPPSLGLHGGGCGWS
jgi:hypothetical protein